MTQELLANVSGVSKACQLRSWICLAAHSLLPVIYFLEELGAAAQPVKCCCYLWPAKACAVCLAAAADSAGLGVWLLKEGPGAVFCSLLLLSCAAQSHLIQLAVIFCPWFCVRQSEGLKYTIHFSVLTVNELQVFLELGSQEQLERIHNVRPSFLGSGLS